MNTSLLIEPALNDTSTNQVHIVHRYEGDKHISPINDISSKIYNHFLYYHNSKS